MNDSQRPVMIFHTAYRLDPESKSASGIRPIRMRNAFEAIGFDVIEISGHHPERRRRIREIKQSIRRGLNVDFVYSESSTAPVGLGEPVTLATSRTRDIAFLRFCQRRGIPVGLFYRDIYWRFPIYADVVRWPLSALLRACFRQDLRRYRRADITMYLPSREMQQWVPIIKPERFKELPPGGEPVDDTDRSSSARLRLLYVGGLGDNYRMHETLRMIAQRDDVQLTLCTREAEWQERKAEYREWLAPNIQVVHESGSALDELYREADICLLVVEPITYWGFAVPVKLFEYLAHGKPMIATEGTYSGRFVNDTRVGWVVQYGSDDLPRLLDQLNNDRLLISHAASRAQEVRVEHTWEKRAKQVARELASERTEE